jgi:integrase
VSLEGRAFPNLHIGRIGLVAHYFLLPASGYTLTNVEHAWRIIPGRIGLHDVRIHELRRTAASWLAIDGANLPVIQQVLNHSSLTCTQVYARLSIASVRQALDQQAERILATIAPPNLALEGKTQEWPG